MKLIKTKRQNQYIDKCRAMNNEDLFEEVLETAAYRAKTFFDDAEQFYAECSSYILEERLFEEGFLTTLKSLAEYRFWPFVGRKMITNGME